jgi:hypothetical protein
MLFESRGLRGSTTRCGLTYQSKNTLQLYNRRMQAPTKTPKTHYSPANTQSILLERQKDALLVILAEYIEKTTDKSETLLKLSNLDPSIKLSSKTCSNC